MTYWKQSLRACLLLPLLLSKSSATDPLTYDLGALAQTLDPSQQEHPGVFETHALSPDNALFTAKVESSREPTVLTEGLDHFFLLWMGSLIPVQCVLAEKTGAATWDQRKVTDKTQKDATLKIIKRIDVGVMGGNPFLYTQTQHNDANGNQTEVTAGVLKILTVSMGRAVLRCMHQDIGNEKTFRRMVEGVVTSIVFKPHPDYDAHKYREVTRIRVGNEDRGFSETLLFLDPSSGKHRLHTFSSVLTPRPGNGYAATDTVTVEWSDSHGTVEKIKFWQGGNDEKLADLEVQYIADGKYSVKGEMKSQKVDATFLTKKGLQGQYMVHLLLKNAFWTSQAKRLKTLSFNLFNTADALHPIEAMYSISKRTPASDGLKRFDILSGNARGTVTKSPIGFYDRIVLGSGANAVTSEYLAHDGAIPEP